VLLKRGIAMETAYHKRKLPHIQCDGMPNFITFRVFDSVDEYIKKLSLSNINTKEKRYKIDKYLDNSSNGAYFYGKQIEIIKNIIFEYDKIYYELYSFVIMPNHIHILLLPKSTLLNILKKIKGKSAKLLNESLNKKGRFWAREYYDKIVKDEKQFKVVMEYILNNPVKANLNDAKDRIYNIFTD
jgi:REP element-mobilizing transposase RayT